MCQRKTSVKGNINKIFERCGKIKCKIKMFEKNQKCL